MTALAEKPVKVARVVAAAKASRQGSVPNAPWPVVPLGELAASEPASITDGPFGSKLKSAHYTASGPRVVRLTNIGEMVFVDAKVHISEAHFDSLKRHRVFPDDLVIAALGENPPRACMIPDWLGPAIVKADCIRFKCGPRILPKFMLYALHQPELRRHAKSIIHGVGRPRLNLGEIKSLPIPLPPLPEQRRIVAEIEQQFTRLDAGVAALRRTQANLKRYRAAVLKAACEGRLLSSDSNWPITPVGELAHVVTKGSSPNWQGFEYCDTGILFVRSQNVGWGHLDLSDVARLPAGFNEKEKKSILKAGDVLLNIVGASIGRAAVATIEIEGGNVNQAVAVIRPITSRVSSKYLACYLLSDKAQALIHSQKVDVARANLSLEQIRNLPIPLPPLADQTRIVAEVDRRLSVTDEIENNVAAVLTRAKSLRQSLLQRAFAPEK